nr:acyl carrier protein [uncultured Lachnoclostridium sp.]
MEIKEIFANVLACEKGEIEANLKNLEFLNSLKRMECIFALEDEYEITFLPSDIEKCRCLYDLLEICKCKLEV